MMARIAGDVTSENRALSWFYHARAYITRARVAAHTESAPFVMLNPSLA